MLFIFVFFSNFDEFCWFCFCPFVFLPFRISSWKVCFRSHSVDKCLIFIFLCVFTWFLLRRISLFHSPSIFPSLLFSHTFYSLSTYCIMKHSLYIWYIFFITAASFFNDSFQKIISFAFTSKQTASVLLWLPSIYFQIPISLLSQTFPMVYYQ